jgi:hypothetical protein
MRISNTKLQNDLMGAGVDDMYELETGDSASDPVSPGQKGQIGLY